MNNYKAVNVKEMAYRVWDKLMGAYDNSVVVTSEGSLVKHDDEMSGHLISDTQRYEIHQYK